MNNENYVIDANVVYTELDENEGVLLHLVTQRYYTLNETGSLIWTSLQSGKSASDISEIIEAEYDIPDADQFVVDFLEELSREGLINTVQTQHPARDS